MPDLQSTIERAEALARSGELGSVNAIRQQLRREGHLDVGTALQSPAVNRNIIRLIQQATI